MSFTETQRKNWFSRTRAKIQYTVNSRRLTGEIVSRGLILDNPPVPSDRTRLGQTRISPNLTLEVIDLEVKHEKIDHAFSSEIGNFKS